MLKQQYIFSKNAWAPQIANIDWKHIRRFLNALDKPNCHTHHFMSVKWFLSLWKKSKYPQYMQTVVTAHTVGVLRTCFTLLVLWLALVNSTNNLNSLWPSDAIWWEGSRLILVQVMTCCPTAPSHYLDQCWHIITKVQWYSSEGNFAWDVTAISH